MRFKAFLCEVLAREFYYWAAASPHIIDIELLDSYYHEYPQDMHKILQEKIDFLEEKQDIYDYIVLGFGLCGKVLENLKSRSIPIVIPKAHDCITLFMGSKEVYAQYFRDNPGTIYYIASWLERNGLKKERKELASIGLGESYDDYVKKYGEENAKYLIEMADQWKKHYNSGLYMDNKLIEHDFTGQVAELAQERGWKFSKKESDSSLIKKLLWGEWNEQEYLIVDRDSLIYSTYDEDIIKSKK